MSQDYHDYEQLCNRNRLLAFAWLTGARMYYVGFLSGFMVAIAAPLSAVMTWLRGAQVGLPLWSTLGISLFAGCVLLFLIGSALNELARRSGEIE
jgi:hypothetical protein